MNSSRQNRATCSTTTPMTRVTTVAVLYSTERSRSVGDFGRSHSSWSRISHRIIATIDRTVAALIRHGPIVSANNQIVLVASAIAPVANAPTRTFDSPVTSRHGRFARTIPDSSRSRRSPEGAKYRMPSSICADGNRRAPPGGLSSGSPRMRAIASSVTVRTRRSMLTPPTPATEMSANLWSALTSATTGRVSSRRGRSVRYTTMSSSSEDGSTVSMTSAKSACSSGRYGLRRTHVVHRRPTRSELRRRSGRYSAMRSATAAGLPGSAMNSTEACSPAAPERPSCKCSFAFTAFAYPLGLPPNPSQWVRVDHGAAADLRRLCPVDTTSGRGRTVDTTTTG